MSKSSPDSIFRKTQKKETFATPNTVVEVWTSDMKILRGEARVVSVVEDNTLSVDLLPAGTCEGDLIVVSRRR